MRIINNDDYTQNYGMVVVYCLSSEEKPVDGIVNGSICYEIDTNKAYLFDEENGLWIQSIVSTTQNNNSSTSSDNGIMNVTLTDLGAVNGGQSTVQFDASWNEMYTAMKDGKIVRLLMEKDYETDIILLSADVTLIERYQEDDTTMKYSLSVSEDNQLSHYINGSDVTDPEALYVSLYSPGV